MPKQVKPEDMKEFLDFMFPSQDVIDKKSLENAIVAYFEVISPPGKRARIDAMVQWGFLNKINKDTYMVKRRKVGLPKAFPNQFDSG